MLSLTLVFWFDFLWGQIAIQFLIVTLMLIIIQYFNPLSTPNYQKLETFNELVCLNLTTMLMTFSDYTGDVIMRQEIGYAMISLVCLYCVVHIAPILKEDFWRIKHLCRRQYYKRRKQWIMYQRSKQQGKKVQLQDKGGNSCCDLNSSDINNSVISELPSVQLSAVAEGSHESRSQASRSSAGLDPYTEGVKKQLLEGLDIVPKILDPIITDNDSVLVLEPNEAWKRIALDKQSNDGLQFKDADQLRTLSEL